MFLDHDDLDADEVDMRGDLAGSQSVQQASSSRARMLAQQRELQQRKKQQSLSAAGKIKLGGNVSCLVQLLIHVETGCDGALSSHDSSERCDRRRKRHDPAHTSRPAVLETSQRQGPLH